MTDTSDAVTDVATEPEAEPTEQPEEPAAAEPHRPRDPIGRITQAWRDRRPAVIARTGLVITTVAAASFAGLWHNSAGELERLHTEQADSDRARDIAGKYAVGASTFDYRNLDAWKTALKTGVNHSLEPKFDSAIKVLDPLLQQLQWVSTAKMLASTVASHTDGLYTVQVFVDMNSTSVQFSKGMSSTATYTVTIDPEAGWVVTDVGGIGAGLGSPERTSPGSSAPSGPRPAPTPGG
ncbi:hypothetical protein AB0346_08080 [Nocardia beijingensis]|uniref:hypothetical protein n=1 Tax=Nocardia beijingensis TaxID=95162 RepID=UPI00344C300F